MAEPELDSGEIEREPNELHHRRVHRTQISLRERIKLRMPRSTRPKSEMSPSEYRMQQVDAREEEKVSITVAY